MVAQAPLTTAALPASQPYTHERHHRPTQASKQQIRTYFKGSLLSKRAYAIAIFDTILEVSVNQFRAGQRSIMSYAELAELVGCSLNTTKRVIKGLSEIGLISDISGESPRLPRTFEISTGRKELSSGDSSSETSQITNVLKGQYKEINRPLGTANVSYLSPGDSKYSVICPQGTDESLGEACSSGLSDLSINESINEFKNDSFKNDSVIRLSDTNKKLDFTQRRILKNTLKSLLIKLDPAGSSGADITQIYNLFAELSETISLDDFLREMRQAADLTQYSPQEVRRPIPYFFGVLKASFKYRPIGEDEGDYREEIVGQKQLQVTEQAPEEKPSEQEDETYAAAVTPLRVAASASDMRTANTKNIQIAEQEETSEIKPVTTPPPALWSLITTKLGQKEQGFVVARQRMKFLARNVGTWTIGLTNEEDLRLAKDRWAKDLEKELKDRGEVINLIFELVR